MEALRLTPAYKDYIWGGQRLKTEYGKTTDLAVVAESWELSLHEAGLSRIAGTNVTLRDWLRRPKDFPILVKLIDAKEDLSVQVHPGDDYALAKENRRGKTEMWYVVDHDPDAALYIGFKRDVTRREIIEAIGAGSFTNLLRKVTVRRGDVYFIPAGTVHAIGKGNLLAEVQQNSDLTYRLYDYGRLDPDGQPRPLHVEQALDVMDRTAATPIVMTREIIRSDESCRETLLNACPHFTVYGVETVRDTLFETVDAGCFELLLFLDGTASVTPEAPDNVNGDANGANNANGDANDANNANDTNSAIVATEASKGASVFIPAGPGSYRVGGGAYLLRIFGGDVRECRERATRESANQGQTKRDGGTGQLKARNSKPAY
jgi:mannose-6-phosphate isomerase